MAFNQLNNISMDEDDEDLEALRLAALQSIHKKVAAPFDAGLSKPKESLQQKIYSPTNRRARGGFHQNNRGRNGLFNNHNQRSRNTNLISIPTEAESPTQKIDPPKAKSTFAKDTDNPFKLMLPQDRYCNISVEKEVKEQPSSKFSRYDNSDDSESESEDEESDESDAESTGVLKKAGSLEALMQELENEIQGKSNDPKIDTDVTKVPKIKRRNKRLRTSTISSTIEKDSLQDNLDTEPINSPEHHDIPSNDRENTTEKNNDKTDNNKELSPDKIQTLKQLPDVPKESQNVFNRKPSPPQMMRNRSPPPHLLSHKQPISPPYMHRKRSPKRQHPSHNNTSNYNSNSFHTYPSQFRPQQITPFAPPYNAAPFPPFGPPPLDIIRQQPPPFLPRPISPLAINTEALCTITKAPLSPRSAAFVLQNREIIAQRRRKSPKRSPTFSRSPSPRRSLSPLLRRSPRSLSKSPNRNRGRSRSPLPPRRLSPPRGGRNNSPPRRRRSMSLESVRRNAQVNRKPMRERRGSPLLPKQSVRDRLGVRGKEVAKVEKSTQNNKEAEARAERVIEDPILEARKRKFERTEISIKDGGVIKLKKDEEQQEEPPTSTIALAAGNQKTQEEEDLLMDDVLDTKVDDIFSDDDDDENEGRFKTFDKVEVTSGISISKALNGNRDIKIEPLIKECSTHKRNIRDQSERLDRERKKRRRTLSPVSKEVELEQDGSTMKATNTALSKQRLVRSAKVKKILLPRVTSPIESKKIEIKIRNPAKYEEASRSKYDVATEDEMRRTDETKRDKKERQVDMLTEDTGVIVEDDGDTVAADTVDNMKDGDEEQVDSCTVENKSADGGDLRAQLSRKRAERQNNHHSVVEVIQSRLLQTALQDAVFKKVKKSKRSKHGEGTLKDGKLPIHLRLGLGGNDVQIYTEHRKKSKKSKHRSLDQV